MGRLPLQAGALDDLYRQAQPAQADNVAGHNRVRGFDPNGTAVARGAVGTALVDQEKIGSRGAHNGVMARNTMFGRAARA